MDRMLRKYPDASWLCRDQGFKCIAYDLCASWYPNLICDHGFRPLPEMEAK